MMGRLGLAIGLSLALSMESVRAEEVTATGSVDTRAVVMIVDANAPEETVQLVVRAVQSQLSDLDVTFDLNAVEQLPSTLPEQVALAEIVAADATAVGVFWCDFTNREQVFLYLRGREGDRILVRKLQESDVGGMSEALAVIVRTSVGELLRGGRVGIEVAEAVVAKKAELQSPIPIEPDESVDTGRAPVADSPVFSLVHRLGYVFQSYSAEQPTSHGLRLGLSARVQRYLWLFADHTIVGPLHEKGNSAAIQLRRHPTSLGLQLAVPLEIFELGASIAGVLDYVTFEVQELAPGMTAVNDRDDLLFALSAAAEARLQVFTRVQLLLCVGVEFPVSTVHYVAQTPDGQEVILDAWAAQPWVLGGLAIELW